MSYVAPRIVGPVEKHTGRLVEGDFTGGEDEGGEGGQLQQWGNRASLLI